MKFSEIKEDGRIVKGVNTTDDVGPNEIKIQTAKFGNTVDKDGKPPTLSKKVKGSSTNVLFNMGLAESLNLAEAVGEIASATEIYVDMDGVLADFFGEWAKLMDVDHFSDINKQHDINDALQKIRDTDDFWLKLPILPEAKNLLNLIKKVRGEYSICTSPLADDPNSEKHKRTWVEKNLAFFPPKEVHVTHNKPQFATAKDGTPNILIDDYGVNINAWEAAGGIGFKYKDHKFERTAKDIKQHMDAPVEENITEAFDNPYPIKWLSLRPDSSSSAKASLDDGSELEIHFADDDAGYYDIEFLRSGSMKVSGEGDEFRVFATVQAAILEWWKQADKKYVRAISFSADKGDNNRSKLYKRFAEMWAKKIKWQFKSDDGRRDVEFSLIRPKAVEENFADGKVKGKSRPGRVKKSGASCNGSVTDLRAKAKKASGEKAKMLHWCANMKSGRS